MGQSKSKTWRRLSESDCSHLMLGNHHCEVTNGSHESNLNRHSHHGHHPPPVTPPAAAQSQQSQQSQHLYPRPQSITSNQQKMQRRLSHLYPLPMTPQGPNDISVPADQSPAYDTICGTSQPSPSCSGSKQQDLAGQNKTLTLTKFSRLDSIGSGVGYPGGQSGATPTTNVTLRNSLHLPRPPSPIITTISDQISANQQIPNKNYRRLINSVCLLTGDRLDRIGGGSGVDEDSCDTEDEDDYSSINDPATPPPSYMDQCFSGPNRYPQIGSKLNPAHSSNLPRPISMYQFEPGKVQPSPPVANRKQKYPEPVRTTVNVAPGMGRNGPNKFHRLSLSDLLERLNSFEECAQFDDQITPTVQTPEGDSGSDQVTAAAVCSNQLITAQTDQQQQQTREGSGRGKLQQMVRCSGLDCMCDRCMGQRFKLLNWLLPNCTRINAERLLNGRLDGTFLVRKSEKFPGQYTLSFVCKRTVRHCLIMRSVYGFGLRWPYSFETLQQVIAHYARQSLVEFNSKLDVRLKYPVFMIGT